MLRVSNVFAAVVGGICLLALILTLVATPVVFSWLDDLSHARWTRRFGRALTWPLRKLDELVTRKDGEEPGGGSAHEAAE